MADKTEVEVVVSFDTTGSMAPCIRQVRSVIESMTKTLFEDIPNFRMGLIAHGDYCDEGETYVIKEHEFTTEKKSLIDFIRNCGDTYGGDVPECYELVLHRARSLNWTADKSKILVLIGDATPHSAGESQNKGHLDWKNEVKCLAEMGVKVYAVQALNHHGSNSFYETLAKFSDGLKLELDQFSEIVDLIKAICYRQVDIARVEKFVETIQDKGCTITRTMVRNFETLTGKTVKFKDEATAKRYKVKDLEVVPAGRFQVMDVPKDYVIKDFVQDNGLIFKPGRGFYQFIKSVIIQDYKEVILQDKVTGDFFMGDKARDIIGLPRKTMTICPSKTITDQYIAFVQSTSYNRKLLKDTKFLYEVDSDR